MKKSFAEYLDEAIEKLEEDYNQELQRVRTELDFMKIGQSVIAEAGAVNWSKIETLTIISAKWKALTNARGVYQYLNKQ